MNVIVMGVAVALVIMCLQATALPIARALVSTWVWLYTQGLHPAMRMARRAEMRSHLWEQAADSKESGYRPDLAGLRMLLQALLGIPQDISWRWTSSGKRSLLPIERVTNEGETFEAVYDMYYPYVFAYVYSIVRDEDDATNVAQACFEWLLAKQLWQSPGWEVALYRLARAKVRNAIRQRSRRDIEEVAELLEVRVPASDMSYETRKELLVQAVGRMPLELRQLISLKFDAELSNREIASLLGTSEANVRIRVSRCLAMLRRELAEISSAQPQDRDDDEEPGAPVTVG